MSSTVGLWLLLRRRDAGRSDPQRTSSVLAVTAFAVATAVMLLVIGGFLAFQDRAAQTETFGPDAGLYVVLAGIATALLLIPLATLGAAASRLAVARRDERLAALRLSGATTGQVTTLALLDSTTQALVGALIGVAGYFGLIPLVLPIAFQGVPFLYSDLLVPPWLLPAVVAGITAVAILSAGASLRRVAISPLGVVARTSPSPLHWSRVIPIIAILGGFTMLMRGGQAPMIVLIIFLAGGLAVVNLVGPLILGGIGRMAAKRASTAAALIAARRLIDAPKTAWRSVGGVALATFVAGIAASAAMFGALEDGGEVMADIGTGGLLTLGIAAVLAATSTGVMQAGRIIDQRKEYRALRLAGTDDKVLNRARMLEVAIPLVAAVALATIAAGGFLLPALGVAVFTSPAVAVQFVLSVLGACALVLLGSWASKGVVRTVLA